MRGISTKICQRCGKEYIGNSRSKICSECESVKPHRKTVSVGEIYGCIKVDSIADKSYRCYNCHCLKCGNNFTASGSNVFKYADIGCGNCRKSAELIKREEEYRKYIGTLFGDLEVVGYAGRKPISKKGQYLAPYMICKCQKCESVSEVPLSRLKSGGAKECKHCAKKHLETGYKLNEEFSVDGTLVTAIGGRRKRNKNSTTLHAGVSFLSESGKYRAYIYFRRKQYYLGSYDKIDDAIAARKEAEEKIYGPFLEWYANSYPESWKKLNGNS